MSGEGKCCAKEPVFESIILKKKSIISLNNIIKKLKKHEFLKVIFVLYFSVFTKLSLIWHRAIISEYPMRIESIIFIFKKENYCLYFKRKTTVFIYLQNLSMSGTGS